MCMKIYKQMFIVAKICREYVSEKKVKGAQSCRTLCYPMDCSTTGFPVHHHLPEFAQTHLHWVNDAIQPSHPLTPFSSYLQSSPASGCLPLGCAFILLLCLCFVVFLKTSPLRSLDMGHYFLNHILLKCQPVGEISFSWKGEFPSPGFLKLRVILAFTWYLNNDANSLISCSHQLFSPGI